MTVHPRVRALAALAASLLLAGGFYAYSLVNAPRAHASTQVTGGLDVSVNPGSTTVGVGTVSTTVTYTCTDTGAPGGQAALRVEFDQNDNDATGEVGVACGSSDVNVTQTVTATQVGMSGSQEITVDAALTDGSTSLVTTGDELVGSFNNSVSPTATYPGNGTVTVTGTYNCDSTITTPLKLLVTANQVSSSNVAAAGTAAVTVSTCNSTNQSWSAPISVTLPRGSFDSTRSLDIGMVNPGFPSFNISRPRANTLIVPSS